MRAASALGLALLALALAAAAGAARAPNPAERTAIRDALPSHLALIPSRCVRLGVRVSANGRYATATPTFLIAGRPACVRYASNGYWLLVRTDRWRILFEGSDPPPCWLGVPRDLAAVCVRG